MMEYTGEQLGFITDRGHNILVSAAAGSGKTAVIVERVIRLITEDRYAVDELLIVTFTKAAAAEMRDRIRDALSAELIRGELDAETREHLEKQMTLIFSADITTIDSFCLNLVREHFNICKTDPSFRVADEGELKLIAEEVMDRLLEEKYESNDEGFYRFVDAVSTGRDDSAVADAIRSVYSFAIARPDPEGYIASMTDEYTADTAAELESKTFMHELMDIAGGRIALAKAMLMHAADICDMPAGPFFYRSAIDSDMTLCDTLSDINTYSGLKEALEEADFVRLPSKKKDYGADDELCEKVKRLRERAKKIIKTELGGELFSKSTDDVLYEMRMCLPEVKLLADLAAEYYASYSEAKRDRSVADFADLEHMALSILSDSETRDMICRRYRELIIDEYQDCNRVQEEIFTAISNGHNYVTVGDVKQSIYSFRDACPELFMDKYKTYADGEDSASRLITLSKNFRSSAPVTETINAVFERIMTPKCGGALYDDSQSLHYGELYETGISDWKSEYIIAETDPDKNEDALNTEARVIADRILELVGTLELEDRKNHEVRKCGFNDIVILLRSVKGASDTFADVFAARGIPLIFDSRSGYLLSYEIKEIINLLTVIDNPRQDIYLAGVMMGYFGGFDASEMVYVRDADSTGDLYDSLRKAAEDNDREGLAEKCRDFLAVLDRYRREAVYKPIHELISGIIADFKYDCYVRAMPDGQRREGNLRLLKKRAADYEQTSFHGLFKFLRYIENMKRYDIEPGAAAGSGQVDAVRVMSIHHSKGLEFPVVFVSTLRKGFNRTDTRAAMLFDDDIGIGADLIIRDRNLRIRTLIKRVIAKKKDMKLVSEEMRVLYVAMTRAENKLVLTAKADERVSVKTDASEAASLADFIDVSVYDKEEMPFILKRISYKAGEETAHGETDTSEASIADIIELSKKTEHAAVKALIKDIQFAYPYERSLKVPQKVSVSYIKHEAMEEKGVSIASDPRGDRVVPTAGAMRGTAVHTAFEHLPLDMRPEERLINEYLDKLLSDKKLSKEEREYIRAEDISDFLKSDICGRMRAADLRHELYREQPFIISVPASDVNGDFPAEDRIMVQGIIDAFFTENGRIVVVDYKTDRVDDERILVERYHEQLTYYEKALCQLMDINASEKVIYSVSLSKEVAL